MMYVIFDSVLVDHTWSEAGHLQIKSVRSDSSSQSGSLEAERQSLLARLVLRSISDPVMSRAARRLAVNPSTQLDLLALEVGVSERCLRRGLRAILGVSPDQLRRSMSCTAIAA